MTHDRENWLCPLGDKDGQVIDFEEYANSAGRFISGTCQDLIRDGYDEPHRWMHNAHAQPDDRRKALLLGRGWSLTPEKRQAIADSGIPAMAINNYPKDGPKPRYWCSGDGPGLYSNRIWNDADVMKFSPVAHVKMHRAREDAYEDAKYTVDAPNTHFFHAVNDLMGMESWLHVPYVAWGTSLGGLKTPKNFHDSGSGRSSMLIGLRLLWHLGYREVYLVGCDCTPHHHPAPNYWKVMFHYIDQLRPTFDRFHYSVYQTNPDSHLRTFDFAEFDDAIA